LLVAKFSYPRAAAAPFPPKPPKPPLARIRRAKIHMNPIPLPQPSLSFIITATSLGDIILSAILNTP
jgi:hypothetical protein